MYSRYQRAAVREANYIKYFESSGEDYGDEDEEGKEKKDDEKSEGESEASGSEAESSDEEQSESSDEERPVGRRKNAKKAAKAGVKPGKALVQTNLKQYVGPPKRGGRQPTAA